MKNKKVFFIAKKNKNKLKKNKNLKVNLKFIYLNKLNNLNSLLLNYLILKKN